MSAATKGKHATRLVGTKRRSAPVKAGQVIYQGCLVMLDSSGYAYNAAASSGNFANYICGGIATDDRGVDRFDNTNGTDGAIYCHYFEGAFVLGGCDAVAGDEGKPVFASDNQTTTKTYSSTKPAVGRVAFIDQSGNAAVYVASHSARQVQTELTNANALAAVAAITALTDNTGGTAGSTLAAITQNDSLTDSTGGTASTTLAAITAGASYAQADMTATKNALASLAAENAKVRTALGVAINSISSRAAKINAIIAAA